MSVFQQTLGSRNTSCRGTGLKVTTSRRSRVVPDGLRKNAQNESNRKGQAILPLKILMRKTASRCLLHTWSRRKFKISLIPSYLKLIAPLKNLV
jgi:hypothetical protein